MWNLFGEAPSKLSMLEDGDEVKLPIDLQSKNTMVNVAQNKAAIDYCACPTPPPLPHLLGSAVRLKVRLFCAEAAACTCSSSFFS